MADYTRDQIYAAMREADKAGDADAVRMLAGQLDQLPDDQQRPDYTALAAQDDASGLPKSSAPLDGTVTDTSGSPMETARQLGSSFANAGAGLLEGLLGVPDALWDAATSLRRGANSVVGAAGGAALDAIGADGAADWWRRGSEGVEQDLASMAKPSTPVTNGVPVPEGGAGARFAAQMIGGAMTPLPGGAATKAAQIPEAVEAAAVPGVRAAARPVAAAADEALAAAPAATSAVGEATAPLAPDAMEEITNLARQAVTGVSGKRRALRTLAERAKVNPEAKAAADRLGIELPPDVLSDNAQFKSLVGLTRSQAGSQAEAAWRNKLAQTSQIADDALAGLGASRDLSQANDNVFSRMNGAMEGLQRQGDALRREVDAAIDVRSRAPAQRLQQELGGIIEDYGGLKEAKQAFSREERKMLAMLGEGETAISPTYARLNEMRDQIGRALNKNEGPWVDAPRANLKRYYAALADDQIAHIEATAGPEIADKMRASNTLFKKMFDAREEMQDLFGRDLDKSLAPMLNRALTQGGKGDAGAFAKLLSRVPEDMRGGLLTSGILSQATSKASHGGFSFANFAKVHRGLRENKPIYAEVVRAIGPEGNRILSDLYAISRRVAEADSNVLRTGKANQLSAINAETLVNSLMKMTAVKAATTAGAGLAGGPLAAGLAHTTSALLEGGAKRNIEKVHDVLSSPEFLKLVEEGPTDVAVKKFANAPKVARLIPGTPAMRADWLRNTLSGTSPNLSGQLAGRLETAISATPNRAAAEEQDGQ